MISPVTGDVAFGDGFHLSPHEELTKVHLRDVRSLWLRARPGWAYHLLGTHLSSFGPFEVEAVSDASSRLQVVLLSWAVREIPRPRMHPSELSDRQAVHEAILAEDLRGQREFSWGEVHCGDDPALPKNWIVIAYAAGPHVTLHRRHILPHLYEHEIAPESGASEDLR